MSAFDFLRLRLRQGVRTALFPPRDGELPDRFRGRPVLDRGKCAGGCADCVGRMPTGALTVGPDGGVLLDVGASQFTPDESAACPTGALTYTRDYRMASATRGGLVSPAGEVDLAGALGRASRRLFGRALRLRSVSAGSCGGCEAELTALGNVVFDMARFGIQFVASPRHADGIVVTGAVSTNMRAALLETLDATPEPRIVIAVGACAIDGGPFRGGSEVAGGVPQDVPVDLWVPGCPPHPLTILDGLLRLLGRIEAGDR